MSKDQFVVELMREPDHKLSNLDSIVEALVMLHLGQELHEVLSLIEALNATPLMKRSRRQAADTIVDDLRAQIAQVEEQLH